MTATPESFLVKLGEILVREHVSHALIGGHAVNAWLEPRGTTDIDVAIQADAASYDRAVSPLVAEGFLKVQEVRGHLPSGPDFAQYRLLNPKIVLDVLPAKTTFRAGVDTACGSRWVWTASSGEP